MIAISPVSSHITQVAEAVTQKVSELLRAPVLVSSQQGLVIASSKPSQVGQLLHQLGRELTQYLQVPFQFDPQQVGEVIVGQPTHGETVPYRLALALVELIIGQVTALHRVPNQQTLKNLFIRNLLDEQSMDEAAILRQAKLLGVDLNPPRAVLLIDAIDYIQGHPELRQGEDYQRCRSQSIISSIVSFFHLPTDTICADLGGGEIAVLKASDTKNLCMWARNTATESISSSWANLDALKRAGDALLSRLCNDTGSRISIGIGRYHPGLTGLAKSYQDARMALQLGRRFKGSNRVYCLDKLGIAAFACVANEETKVGLARHLLSPLDDEPELLTTLEVFFSEDCCPSTTAKQLSIHRNTLSYRLDKVTFLAGLDPRRFDDAVQIRLALLLRGL